MVWIKRWVHHTCDNLNTGEVSMLDVQVVVALDLTNAVFALVEEVTLLMGTVFLYFFKKFRKPLASGFQLRAILNMTNRTFWLLFHFYSKHEIKKTKTSSICYWWLVLTVCIFGKVHLSLNFLVIWIFVCDQQDSGQKCQIRKINSNPKVCSLTA